MTDANNELAGKVRKWVNEEGYPLEYYVANTLQKNGFAIAQGDYSHLANDTPREIDVKAWTTLSPEGGGLIRLYNVVECKWTRNKPWVVFTSPTTLKMPSAIVAQTLGSGAGETAMWVNSGNPDLTSLTLFHSPESGGFGGRQALSSGQDKFYDALRSIIAASVATVNRYNREIGPSFPEACVVAFPIIVIDGDLFEAHYDAGSDDLRLERREHSRCHWRGGEHSPFSATLDIVTKEGLPEFAARRAADFKILAEALRSTFDQLRDCYNEKNPTLLTLHRGATGTSGYPALWHLIQRRAENG